MESQLHRPYDHTYDQDPQHAGLHSVVEDEGDHDHHEKKSVLKKVKAKAKKIKETLAKHGHGHEQGHEHERDYSHDDPDEDEEDEDEEMVEHPEVHDAPMYESTVIRSEIPAQNVNLEKTTAIGEDRYDGQRNDTKTGVTRPVFEGQSGENLERPSAMEVVHAPEGKDTSFTPEIRGTIGVSGARKENENVGPQGSRIGALEEEDPQAPKSMSGVVPPSNYETKVTDPTGKGGEEVGITPLLQSFSKMGVYDESVPKSESGQEGYTGSHDQFAPAPNPTDAKLDSAPKSYDPSKGEDLPRDTLTGKSSDQSGYVEKISAATSIIADKAISAKNVVASKLGYGGTDGGKVPETDENKNAAKSGTDKGISAKNVVASKLGYGGTDGGKVPETDENKNAAKSGASPTEYAHKVAATVTEKLTPVYGKVADAGSSVMSKVKGSTGTGQEGSEASGGKVPDKGVSVKEYLVEKFKPSEEDKALSEVISETLHKKKEDVGKPGESKPMGKVTESEEVARRLGTGMERKREGEDAIAAGRESSGKSMVDRLKGAVSSWIVKGQEDQQYSQGSADSSNVSNEGSAASDEIERRRLQESGN